MWAPCLSIKEGNGRIITSTGKEDKRCRAKKAEWVCYYGADPKGEPVTITMIIPRISATPPPGMRAELYGLFASNPFGVHDFEKSDDKTKGNHTIKAGSFADAEVSHFAPEGRPQSRSSERRLPGLRQAMSLTRRTLLQRAALITAANTLPVSCFKPKHSHDDIRVAICGLHGRGKYRLGDSLKMDGVRVVALCDVDTREITKHAATVEKAGCRSTDLHKLSQAARAGSGRHPHRHAEPHARSIALTAIANRKHVYVEKPVSHNLIEGRKLVEAAARASQTSSFSMGCSGTAPDLGWEG